jgi:hypothetical protein
VESPYYLLRIPLSASISGAPNGRISVIFDIEDFFPENLSRKPKGIHIGPKYQVRYTKIKWNVFVAVFPGG